MVGRVHGPCRGVKYMGVYKEDYPDAKVIVSKNIRATIYIIERNKDNYPLMKQLENYVIIPSASALIKNFYYVTSENKL
jgi:hypothetical protein